MTNRELIKFIDAIEYDLVALKVKNMQNYDEIDNKLSFVFSECQRIKSMIRLTQDLTSS